MSDERVGRSGGARLRTTAGATGTVGLARRPAPTRPRRGLRSWLLVGWLVFLPVQVSSPVMLRFAPSDLFVGALVVIAFGAIAVRTRVWSVWHTALVVLFCGSLLQTALVQGQLTSYAVANKLLGLALLLAAYVVLTSAMDSVRAVADLLGLFVRAVVLVSGVLLAVYLLGVLSGAAPAAVSNSGRFSGLLLDPNAQGGLLVVAYTLHLATRGSARPLLVGVWAPLAAAVLPVAIVATGSRSAWIGMVIAYLAVIVREPGRAIGSIVSTVVPVAVCLVVLGVSLDSFTRATERGFSIDQRFVILDQALQDFARDPVFGAGIGVFFARHGLIVHNTPAWFLADFGLVGLTLFLGLCAWVLWRAAAAAAVARELGWGSLVWGLVMAHVAMMGLSLGIEAFYQRHWWLVMAAIAALGSPGLRWDDDPDDRSPSPAVR